MGENDRLARQSIEVRSQSALRAEETHAVGARRIQSDQNDIRMAEPWDGARRRGHGYRPLPLTHKAHTASGMSET